MGSLSIWHWLIVLLIVGLVFGTKRLRGFGEDIGHGIRGFKKGLQDPDAATQLKADAAPAANGANADAKPENIDVK